MRTIKTLWLFIIIILIVCSCNHSNTLGKMIPKDAMLIAHFNGRSLSTKLTWDDVKESSWFKRIYSDSITQNWLKKTMENPKISGIDNKGDVVLFLLKNSSTQSQIIIEGDIRDVKEFESFCKSFSTSDIPAKDGSINLLTLKNNAVAGWNNKKFVFVFNKILPPFQKDSGISTHAGYNEQTELITLCKSLFSLNEDSSMRNNNNFTSLLNETADIHIWQNTEQILKNGPSLGMLGMLKLDIFIKNNISTYAINFDEGQIEINQKWYTSKELMDVLKKYSGGNLNTQMIKNIPSQNIVGLINMHFKPEGLAELVKLTGMDGLLNMFLSKQGFNLNDFVSANKGDIQLVISDLKIQKDSTSDSNKISKPPFDFLFVASVGDKSSFNKLIASGKKIGTQMKKDSGFSYILNDQFFIAGNNQSNINKYSAGANNTFSFLDELKEHPLGAYLDLKSLFGTIASSNIKDTSNNQLLNAGAKMWDKLIVTGGKIDDDAFVIHSKVSMIDRSTNSLKQLNSFLDLAAKLNRGKSWQFNRGMQQKDSLRRYMDSGTIK